MSGSPFTGPFSFLPASSARALFARRRADWDLDWGTFEASWDQMPVDDYMADGGRYRRRRYAVLAGDGPTEGADETLVVAPAEPHYQALSYNHLNGGIARHFEPIEPSLLAGPSFTTIAAEGLAAFRTICPTGPVHVEVHQFRIEAQADAAGRPTPEGKHRDGVDFVLVMLVRRVNVAQGTTEIADVRGTAVESFTLTSPCDLVLLDDRRVLHGVTPISPLDPSLPSFRDVLVVTYRSTSNDHQSREIA